MNLQVYRLVACSRDCAIVLAMVDLIAIQTDKKTDISIQFNNMAWALIEERMWFICKNVQSTGEN